MDSEIGFQLIGLQTIYQHRLDLLGHSQPSTEYVCNIIVHVHATWVHVVA